MVTDTEAISDTLPLMVKGSVSWNCDPVACDCGFAYHAANRLLTSTVTFVVCSVAPADGVNWNVAVFISSVVDVPTIVTCRPVEVVVTLTLVIVGTAAAIAVVAEGGPAGVMFTPAALSVSES